MSRGSILTFTADAQGRTTLTKKIDGAPALTQQQAQQSQGGQSGSASTTTECDKQTEPNKTICAVMTGITGGVWGFFYSIDQWALNITIDKTRLSDIFPLSNSTESWAKSLYDIALNLVNYLIVLTLLFLSFVNILHINIDTYAIKKVMPTLVYAVILSNFSILISRLIIDFSDVLTNAIVSDPTTLITNLNIALGFGQNLLNGAAGAIGLTAAVLGASGIGWLAGIAILLVMLIPFVLFVGLMFLFWVRYYLVLALVAVAPLAFIAMATPVTETYFKQWWSLFLKWVFMAPITFLLLFIASQIGAGKNSVSQAAASTQGSFQSFVVACAFVYAAWQVPFQLGGNIMNTWGGLVKKAGRWGAGRGDSYLGDITKKITGSRVNFSGLYGGMKEQMEKREAEKQVQAKGVGAGVEEVRRQALGTIVRGGIHRQNPLTSLRNTFESASRTSELSGVKQLVATGVSGKEMDGKKLINDLDAAIKIGNFDVAKDMLVMAAANGSLTKDKFEQFFRQFKGSNGGEMTQVGAAVSQLIREVAEAPRQVFGNQVTKDAKGKVALLADIDPKAAVKEANTALSKRFSRMSTTRVVQELDYLVKQNFLDENGQPLSPDQTNSDFHQALLEQAGNEQQKLASYSPGGAASQLLQRIQPSDFGVAFHPTSLNEVQGTSQVEKAALETILADAGSSQGRPLPIKPDAQFIQDAFHLLGKSATGQDNWAEIQKALKNEFNEIATELQTRGLTIPTYDKTIGATMLDSISATIRTANSQQMRANPTLERGYRKLQALERTKLNLERRRTIALEHNKTKMIRNLGLNAPRES